MSELNRDNLLRSWKDISAHLGIDVRTCHRWEAKHGMPVHRAEGAGKRSNVFAYKDELDVWFRGTFRNASPQAEKAGETRPWLKWGLPAAGVVALAAALLLSGWLLAKGQPADFAIEGSELVVLDKQKRELWRWDSKYENLCSEKYYRANFQVMNTSESGILPALVIKDIDNDGDVEVVFAPKRNSSQTGEGWVRCFDRRGTELWNFPSGKELHCAKRTYSPDYRVNGFYCYDMDGDGALETIVEAFHAPDWPCQLAVLDASGKKIGEFWNGGYLRQLAFHDLDGDGREELIVVGVNNEYKGGCLVVFDTRDIRGGSPQSGKYACEGMEPGSELYYVTVPYTDVSAAMGFVVDGFNHVGVTENRRISATYGPSLFYEFGFGLEPLQVYWGHGYEHAHDEARKAGKLTSVLDDAYAEALLDGVRWWNGTAMVSEPSKVQR